MPRSSSRAPRSTAPDSTTRSQLRVLCRHRPTLVAHGHKLMSILPLVHRRDFLEANLDTQTFRPTHRRESPTRIRPRLGTEGRSVDAGVVASEEPDRLDHFAGPFYTETANPQDAGACDLSHGVWDGQFVCPMGAFSARPLARAPSRHALFLPRRGFAFALVDDARRDGADSRRKEPDLAVVAQETDALLTCMGPKRGLAVGRDAGRSENVGDVLRV